MWVRHVCGPLAHPPWEPLAQPLEQAGARVGVHCVQRGSPWGDFTYRCHNPAFSGEMISLFFVQHPDTFPQLQECSSVSARSPSCGLRDSLCVSNVHCLPWCLTLCPFTCAHATTALSVSCPVAIAPAALSVCRTAPQQFVWLTLSGCSIPSSTSDLLYLFPVTVSDKGIETVSVMDCKFKFRG